MISMMIAFKTQTLVGVQMSLEETIGSFVVKGANGGKMRQKTINEVVKDHDAVCKDICRFWYGHELSFNLVKNPLFKMMLEFVANYRKGLKPPSYHNVRVNFLTDVDKFKRVDLEKYRGKWRTKCTLLFDGWTYGKSRSSLTFL